MKTFTEEQLLDPWRWCVSVLGKHELLGDSKRVATAIMAPPSTMRALFNGQNSAPRYDLLRKLLKLCIDLEYHGATHVFENSREKKTKVASEQLKIEDLL